MSSNNRKLLELLNMICRICAREDINSIPIFGEEGRKQNLITKIHFCLPVTIQETDAFPKKICLTCLTKLDSFWEMHVLCKEAQTKIENEVYLLRQQDNFEQFRKVPQIEEKLRSLSESYPVSYGDSAVICLAPATVTREAQVLPQAGQVESVMAGPVTYLLPAPVPAASVAAPPSLTEEAYPQAMIEVPRNSTNEQSMVFQNCSVPAAALAQPPVPRQRTVAVGQKRDAQELPQVGQVESVMAPVSYLAPAHAPPAASVAASPSVTEEVYPQSLIQIQQNPDSEPVVYQNCPVPAAASAPPPVPRRRVPPVSVSKPMVSPTTPTATAPRSIPTPLKRQNGETSNDPNAKKLCQYCNKYFTDKNIDHHVSLHLRQKFSTCIYCDKNFRSEEALDRHRCNETIDLDSDDDDEPIFVPL